MAALDAFALGAFAQEQGSKTPAAQTLSFDCLVVDGRTGAPLPAVELRWYPRRDLELVTSQEFFLYAAALWVEDLAEHDLRAPASGRVVTSDAEGRAEIEGSADAVIVVASGAGLWGRTGLLLPSDGQRIELFPDGDLTVRVLTASGSPAPRVPVVIEHATGTPGLRAVPQFRATTDERGIARFAHAFAAIAARRAEWETTELPDSRWSVAADQCQDPRPQARFDPLLLPKDPIELRLPETGSVELTVREGDRPAVLGLDAKLLPTARLSPGTARTGPLRWMIIPGVGAPVVEGRALFTEVGIGVELGVVVQRNSASTPWLHVFQGPRFGGERVNVTLDLTTTAITLVGRIVDSAGAPLARRRVAADLFSLPAAGRTSFINKSDDDVLHRGWGSVKTDEDGRFSITYEEGRTSGGEPLLVLSYRRNSPDSVSASKPLGTKWVLGLHDLGDVVLLPTPVVASGRVVDSAGRPVASATAYIEEEGSPRLTTRCESDGRFELRSAEPHTDLRVCAFAEGFLPGRSLRTTPGARALEVTLELGGQLALDFVLPKNERASDFMFHLERSESDGRSRGWWRGSERGFRSTPMNPGVYSLWIRRGEGERKLVCAGLSVVAGETTHPAPIDLTPVLEPR